MNSPILGRAFVPLMLTAALAAGAPAFAASEARAELSDLRLTLIDLDPGDGVAPAIQFNAGTILFGCALPTPLPPYSPSAPCLSSSINTIIEGSAQPFGQASGHSADARSVLDLMSDTTADGSTVLASGRSEGEGASYWGEASAAGGNFLLTPHTLVSFGGHATLRTAVTGGVDLNGASPASEWARATVLLRVAGIHGHQSQTFTDELEAFVVSEGPFVAPAEDTTSDGMGVSFANLGATPIQGQVNLLVRVAGTSHVVAVPEPATWALWLAALGLLHTRTGARTAARSQRRQA